MIHPSLTMTQMNNKNKKANKIQSHKNHKMMINNFNLIKQINSILAIGINQTINNKNQSKKHLPRTQEEEGIPKILKNKKNKNNKLHQIKILILTINCLLNLMDQLKDVGIESLNKIKVVDLILITEEVEEDIIEEDGEVDQEGEVIVVKDKVDKIKTDTEEITTKTETTTEGDNIKQKDNMKVTQIKIQRKVAMKNNK